MAKSGFRFNPFPDSLVMPSSLRSSLVLQGKAVFAVVQTHCNRGIVVLHITNIREFVARANVGLWRPADEHASALEGKVNVIEFQRVWYVAARRSTTVHRAGVVLPLAYDLRYASSRYRVHDTAT